jgi:hypothetical protein
MRLRTLLPIAALLALSACGDDSTTQTGSTNANPPGSSAAPPPKATPPATTAPGNVPTTPSRP